jgi:hypothetical protein
MDSDTITNYGSITKEAPSCYYERVNYASPVPTSSVFLDTLQFDPKPSEHLSKLSQSPTAASKTITANLQHGLYIFPSRRTGRQDPTTVEPVDFVCMQIKGMKQKVVEGKPVVYSDATIGIFTRITEGPLKHKGTHHLNMARNMKVTVSKNHGKWTLDARTEGEDPTGDLENASVFKGQPVYKDTVDGNTLVWKDMFDSWTGLVDVTDRTAEGLWPESEWPRPSLVRSSAGRAACGGTEDRTTAGSIQSVGGAVTALSSLC